MFFALVAQILASLLVVLAGWSQRTWGTNDAPMLGCRSGLGTAQRHALPLPDGPGSSSWLPPGTCATPMPGRAAAPHPAWAQG
jgi:hypothetical protein